MANNYLELTYDIGKWLKKLRVNNRLSTSEVALGTGRSVILIDGWEQGLPVPAADLIHLLNYYQVGPDLFIAKFLHFYKRYSEEPTSHSK